MRLLKYFKMNSLKYIIIVSLLPLCMQAQEYDSTFFDKKPWRFGFVFQQSWSTIVGSDLPDTYFAKPSTGGGFQAEYQWKKNWLLGVGLNFQQRGAGIITPDYDQSLGNPDSTHRFRVRLNFIDVPLSVRWRASKHWLIKGTRPTVGVSLVPGFNFNSDNIRISVEDGFDSVTDLNDHFNKFDVSASAYTGLDFAAIGTLFQVQLFGNVGALNPYSSSGMYSRASGRNILFGLRVGALF